jgi:hypothetical protein
MIKMAFGIALGLFIDCIGSAVANDIASAVPDMPAEIREVTQHNIAACKAAGGTPKFSGIAMSEAGPGAENLVGYLTETELNDDGLPDYIIDLAGLECVNAWSFFCGSAGCPVSVWLSGPAGYSVAWSGNAQGWGLRGTEIAVTLHGQLCTPPRIGAESCEVSMRFNQEPTSAEIAVPIH